MEKENNKKEEQTECKSECSEKITAKDLKDITYRELVNKNLADM